jgi:DNA-binding protein HU-beta
LRRDAFSCTGWRAAVVVALRRWSDDVNKSELIDRIHESSGLSRSDAESALNAFIDAVQSTVAAGDKVTLPGFGVFGPKSSSARMARNPRTGEAIHVPASKSAKFTVGAKFKAQVSGS